ncbi:spermidine/putrescine ABC transporter permease [Candidatus Paracaedibacter acanthamoebae]|uniref:Spermidine/putrescine ABC transporter permease n=2 Tax=Candidatus Odyssella acanthamoebae TaxID=91604 RepID=A0A077B1R9_9PROT|nr:spermidine/putrescine ABC transporter permease [Candidatus Paracaedibacter acanthamoebae]
MDQNTPLKRHYSRRRSALGDRQLVTAVPYLWLILFFLIPFLLVFKISLSESVLAVPPYLPIFEWAKEGFLNIHLNIGNYLRLFLDPFYASGLMTSLVIAFVATLVCLVLGYTIAYSITRVPEQWRFIFLLLVILPFWTSFLVRVYAWMGILSKDGLLNQLLLSLGLIQEPKQFLYNNFSVIVGIVYCYLPFMILPIYSVLEKIDEVYLEAAYDLGCSPWRAFWRVTFPLSLPGVLSGVALVFIPALGEFVIPELLGAPDNLMIGRIIWIEFFNNRDWPIASTVAVVMLLMFIVPIMVLQRRQLRKQG